MMTAFQKIKEDLPIWIIPSLLLCLIFILWMILDSNTANITQAQRQVSEKQQALHWMTSTASRIKSMQTQTGNGKQGNLKKAGALLVVVEKTSRQMKLNFSKVQPKGEKSIRVSFPKAAINPLMNWLHLLTQDYGLQINSLSIRKIESGMVDASVQLVKK